MTTHNARTLILACAMAISLIAVAAPKKSILTVKETISDSSIVFPESFETDTREMMKNWYLRNYAVMDSNVENRNVAEVSDAEYIKRLSAIPTTIELPYNQIVHAYIDRYITRERTLVEEMLGMSLYYMPIFEQALEKEQLPLELKYLPVIESALNPNAVSNAGAAGLWQFTITTGKSMGLDVNTLVDERRDPYRSSEAAAKYLKNLYNIYKDWSLAIAAYNCGAGNVNKALRRASSDGGGKDFWSIYFYLPKETRGYVPAFIAANYIMTYYKLHNISPSLAKKPLITDTVSVKRRINFNQISAVLNIPLDEIRVFNPQYRHDIIPGDTRPYMLVLPSQQIYSYIMSEDSIAGYRADLYARRDVVEPGGSAAQDVASKTAPQAEYYKVRRGETLASIAKKFGTNTDELKQLNALSSTRVKRGQMLKIRTAPTVQPDVASADDAATEGNEATQLIDDSQMQPAATSRKPAANSPYAGSYSVEAPAAPAKTTTASLKQEQQRGASNATAMQSRYGNSRKSTSTSKRNETTAQQKSRVYRNAHSSRSSRNKASQEPATTNYTIKSGESLSTIAEKTGVSVAELRKANNIKGDKIVAGDNLKVPKKSSSSSKSSSKRRSRRK